MIWSFANEAGDVLPQKFHGPTHLLSVNTPEGCIAVAENLDHLSQRIVGGVVVDYQPPPPSVDHEWNGTTKRWQMKPDVLAKQNMKAAALVTLTALDQSEIRALSDVIAGLDILDPEARARLLAIRSLKDAERSKLK